MGRVIALPGMEEISGRMSGQAGPRHPLPCKE